MLSPNPGLFIKCALYIFCPSSVLLFVHPSPLKTPPRPSEAHVDRVREATSWREPVSFIEVKGAELEGRAK